jgi:NAD(P)H dehydrogenase (quinone)
MKVAVTGASGRLGHATLRYLSDEIGPENVIAIARKPQTIDIPNIETRKGDYQSCDEMTEALQGVDSVVLISAPVADGTDRRLLHQNVIEAARRAGVRKLLFTSVIGNGKEENTWFWRTQKVSRQTEEDLIASGLEWIIARNGLYLDLDLEQITAAQKTGIYNNSGEDGLCGYISIDELGYATAKLASDSSLNSRTYNLTSENVTQAHLVDLANHVFGIDVVYESINDEENIARLMKVPRIAARGEDVARMLTGCFQSMRNKAFEVPSDFEHAAGRPCKSILDMMQEIRQRWIATKESI